MANWPPINRDDLRAAASSAGFDTVFPLLVRRLIAETAEGLTAIDMPGGSGTAAGGFDGVVTATGKTPFVPDGTSAWELSVGGGQKKANDDYSKRTAGPNGLPTIEVTYVEALLAPWTKSRDWATDRTAEGRWREVLAYNLDRIHAWLDHAPATTVWLAEEIGKTFEGARSLSSWWEATWLRSTRVPLDESLLLAGRAQPAKQLRAALLGDRRWIRLGGDLRLDEARAFVAAALHQDAPHCDQLAARTLLVSDAATLQRLVALNEPLVFVLDDPTLARDLPVNGRHHFVVIAAPGDECDIEVPRVLSSGVESGLKLAGVPEGDADRFATLARRSIPALRRALAHHPEMLTPGWADSPEVLKRRVLLLGAWHGATRGDQEVLTELLGVPYGDLEEQLLALLGGEEIPLLARVGDLWFVLAVDDAWTLLAKTLTRSDLDAGAAAALEVLSEYDPVLDLEPEQRWAAGLHGVHRKYSDTIRSGLAQTLALVASTDVLLGSHQIKGDAWAGPIVRELFARANADDSYRVWTSLSGVVTLLAEAAPDEFLTAMREGLKGAQPLHAAMFQDADRGPFGFGPSSPHTGFLAALDTVAWSPDYVDEAVDVLAALAQLDPGGYWSNRPASGLSGILSVWCPGTTADTAQRLHALRRITTNFPDVGRDLLVALIPDTHEFQMANPKPRFRDWAVEPKVLVEDVMEARDAVVGILFESLGNSVEAYAAVVDKIDRVSPEHLREFCEMAAALAANGSADEPLDALFDALREKVAHHREYADCTWAMSDDALDQLELACDAVAPSNPVRRYAWLFREPWVALGDLKRRDDHIAYDSEVDRRRSKAVGEILQAHGFEGFATAVASTEHPYYVGAALARHTSEYDSAMLEWLRGDDAAQRQAAEGYFVLRLSANGPETRDKLITATSDKRVQARILLYTREPLTAGAELAQLGPEVEAHYWREFTYFGLGTDLVDYIEIAKRLLEVGRSAAALDLIHMYAKDDGTLEDAAAVAEALEALAPDPKGDPEFGRLDVYHFERLFGLLSSYRDELGEQRIVTLEWQYFPALGLDGSAPTLHSALLKEPAFFVELVSLAWKPDGGGGTEGDDETVTEPDPEQARTVAVRAHDVIRSLHACPGVTPDGELDANALEEWITAARDGLHEAGIGEAGDSLIGGLLAWAPTEADGSVVAEPVRDILENLRSDAIERGLEIGLYNKRSAWTRAVLEGGVQERERAVSYRAQAEQARQWPRTRRLLTRMADKYESEGRREDVRAEGRHQGLGW